MEKVYLLPKVLFSSSSIYLHVNHIVDLQEDTTVGVAIGNYGGIQALSKAWLGFPYITPLGRYINHCDRYGGANLRLEKNDYGEYL